MPVIEMNAKMRASLAEKVASRKVTITCPTYERPELAARLAAIFRAQTHQNWELIIIHDGPDDEATRKELEYFTKVDSRIKYIANPEHTGAWGFHLRNKAIDLATGDYIVFANDDVFYVHEFLEEMLLSAVAYNTPLVFCDMVHNEFMPFGPTQGGQLPTDMTEPRYLRRSYGWVQTTMMFGRIDMGAFMVKTDIARELKFNQFDRLGDWAFLNRFMTDGRWTYSKRAGYMYTHS